MSNLLSTILLPRLRRSFLRIPYSRPSRTLFRSFSDKVKAQDDQKLDRLEEFRESLKIKPTMLIAFTCKICSHRNHHQMSKHAYTKGTVIIQCPCCKNRHLIADHLNWFDKDHKLGKKTVEELVEARGEQVQRTVNSTEELLEFIPNEGT